MRRRFGTLSSIMEMELTEYSETSAHKIHTPEDHPKERIHYSYLFVIIFDCR